MNFFRNAASVLLTSVASTGIGLVISVILARFLSTDDRGFYGLFITLSSLAVLLSQIGWAPASIYRLRRLGSPPDRVATAALLMIVVVSALVTLAIASGAPFLQTRFFEGAPDGTLRFLVLVFPASLATVVFSGIARGIDRFAYQNTHQLVLQMGTAAALAYVLVREGGALIEALSAYVGVLSVVTLGLVLAVLRRTGLELRIDLPEVIESLKFGSRSYLQSLAGTIHERADILMIGLLLEDPSQVAYYSIAVGVATLAKLVPESFSVALFPKLAGLPVAEAGPFVARVARNTLLVTAATLGGLALVAPALMPLIYGSPYAASVQPLLILLPGIAFLSAYRLLARYFIALGEQRINITSQIASTTANILLNLLLIPRYGIAGAAGASLASYLLEAILICVAFRRRSGIGLAETFIPRRSDLDELRALLAERTGRPGRGA